MDADLATLPRAIVLDPIDDAQLREEGFSGLPRTAILNGLKHLHYVHGDSLHIASRLRKVEAGFENVLKF